MHLSFKQIVDLSTTAQSSEFTVEQVIERFSPLADRTLDVTCVSAFHPSLLVQGGGDSAAPPPAPVVDDAAAEALREQVRSLTATVKSLQSHGDPAQLVAKVSSLEAAMRDLRASHDAEVKEHATRLADAGTMTPCPTPARSSHGVLV